jgi:hypothetical protein
MDALMNALVRARLGLVAAMLLFAACVDSPSQPMSAVDSSPLALSFEALSQEMQVHDVDRSEELRWAALAIRAGVKPSVLEITNNGVPEVYDAFVYEVRWITLSQSLRPVFHRNLVAWRRTGSVLQVLLVSQATDSVPVLHPYSMRPSAPGGELASPIAGAKAAYLERSAQGGVTWIGIGGSTKVAGESTQGSCGDDTMDRLPGVACQLGRASVTLSIELARAPTRDSREVPPDAPTRWLHAPEQTVEGMILVFSCATPSADGCQ